MPLSQIQTTNNQVIPNLGRRNLIINGAMNVAQRNTSQGSISSGDGYHVIDRFMRRVTSAGTWTYSQDTDVPAGEGFTKSLKMDCTTANGSLSATSDLQIQYRFEGQDIQHLLYGTSGAKKVTLSFFIKATKTGTNIVQLYQDDGTDHISKAYTVSASNTWEKKTITFDGNTLASINNDNTRGLIVQFHLAAGSNKTSGTLATSWAGYVEANEAVGQVNNADSTNNNWAITGVQLEVGDTTTDFEFELFSETFKKCTRYCQKIVETDHANLGIAVGTAGASATRWYVPIILPFGEMRANPTLSIGSASHYRCTLQHSATDAASSVTIGYNNKMFPNLNVIAGSSVTGVVRLFGHSANAGANMTFDAEL